MEEGFHKAKNKIIIEKRLGDVEIAQIKKHKNCKAIALWRTKHKDLTFLQILSKLNSLEFYSSQIESFDALININTLESLFLNGIKNHEDLSFINQLTQISTLDLLYLPKLEKFPDLSNCKKLTKIMLWNCKKLVEIDALKKIPNIEEIRFVDTPQEPNDLEFLIALDNVKYISAQFGSNKANKQFEDLLAKYGKTKYRPI